MTVSTILMKIEHYQSVPLDDCGDLLHIHDHAGHIGAAGEGGQKLTGRVGRAGRREHSLQIV